MNKMEKKYFAGLMMLIFISVTGCAAGTAQTGPAPTPAMAPAPGPRVMVSPGVAPLDKKTQIIIMGSGFEPEQEVFVVFEDEYGCMAEIKEAKANTRGSWATVWTLGRYTRRGIIKNGVYAIMAMDKELNLLSTAPVAFIKPTDDPEKWPDWAKAAKIKPKKKKK